MGEMTATVLLHPTRMRVVLALGAEELTTKEIHSRLPDVAQASLYRAITRLEAAGVIDVIEHRKRGGAVERVYRVATMPEVADHSSATVSQVVAAVDALAGALSVDAARWSTSAHTEVQPVLRRDVLRLTPASAQRVSKAIAEAVEAAVADQRDDATVSTSVTVVILPLDDAGALDA